MRLNIKQFIVLFVIELIMIMPFAASLSISNVRVEETSDTFALVNWETDEPATSKVEYSTTAALELSKESAEKTTVHSIFLDNLIPSTAYNFRVSSSDVETVINDNQGNLYTLTTAAADTTPPVINVDIPRYSSSAAIDITGTTEPLTKIELYRDGAYIRQYETTTGEFTLSNVELNRFKVNTLLVKAIDHAGNINQTTFEVEVDLENPEITLEIPLLTNESRFLIQGTVSEMSTLVILLNEEVVFSNQTTAFSVEISLEEGANDLEITATDRAGRQDTETLQVSLDTTNPEIENIQPRSGSFFYEGNQVVDITGDTEPKAVVQLLDEKRNKQEETNADANGHFRFKDVDIEKFIEEKVEVDLFPTGFETISAEAEDIEKIREAKPEVRYAHLIIKAIDAMGLVGEENVKYRIGTCFSGQMDWNVQNLVEYQSPTIISPERLAEGTEIISFILKMEYMGPGIKEKIREVSFKNACDSTMIEDPRYNYSCKIISNPYVRSNEKKTIFYVRYNLKKLEGLNNFSQDILADLINSKFIFPLKVTIKYSYEVDGDRVDGIWQTQCMDFAYQIDRSRIDPRKVLPDALLESTIEILNQTIEKLNEIIPTVEDVMKIAAIGCMAGFALKIISVIYRRISCSMNYITDRVDTTKDKNQRCPAPGSSKIGKEGREREEKDKKQVDLLNSELGIGLEGGQEGRCPGCASAWEFEKSAYTAYRWACDRFLCRGTPAKWTGDPEVKIADIRERVEKGILCQASEGTRGTIMKQVPSQECERRGAEPSHDCWEYKGEIFVYDTTADTDDQAAELTKTKGVTVKLGDVILKRVSTGIRPKGVKNHMVVTAESGAVFLGGKGKECKVRCKSDGFKEGICVDKEDKAAIQRVADLTKTHTQITSKKEDGTLCEKGTCYCIGKTKEVIPPPKDAKDEQGNIEWHYRYQKIGYTYSPYKYYEGRDKSACFGRNNFLFAGDPYLSPQELIPTFQCLCISGIRARLVAVRNIMMGLYNCMQQIRTTGEANAGVCKEMFTNYLCKWLYRIISYFTKGCYPWSGVGKNDDEAGIGEYVKAGMSGIFDGAQEATDDLLDDYDNVALRDYLGLGQGTVVEKVCLGVFTGDWGFDLEAFMDAAYAIPFHTSVAAFPSEREYITWNPDNLRSTYEYRTAWMISAGCKIDSYSVSLACITRSEFDSYNGIACEKVLNPKGGMNYNSFTGCDCLDNPSITQTAPGPIKSVFSTARDLEQGVFEDKDFHKVIEDSRRYDHIKIRLNINDGKLREKCLPEGHKDGIFYFPIADLTTAEILACKWDMQTGTFVCDQGGLLWDLRGRAYFGNIKCGLGSTVSNEDCEKKDYYMGDTPTIIPEIYASGADQCLYIKTTNKAGRILLEESYTINVKDNRTTYKPPLPYNILKTKTVELQHFLSLAATYTPHQPWMTRLDKEDGTIIDGDAFVQLRDTDKEPNQNADHFRIKNTNEKFGDWIPLGTSQRTSLNGLAFRFHSYATKIEEGSKCKNVDESYVDEPCKEYRFEIEKRPLREAKTQTWNVHLELRHFPEGENKHCTESTSQDLITFGGRDQMDDKTIKVHTITRQDSRECGDKSGTSPNDRCDCNGDTKIETNIIEGRPGVAQDCDAGDLRYCYEEKDGKLLCHKTKKCLPNKLITEPCDCDLDGTIAAGKKCDGKGKDYCYDNTCSELPKCYTGNLENSKKCDCNLNQKFDEDDCDPKNTDSTKRTYYCVSNKCKKDKPPEPTASQIAKQETENKLKQTISEEIPIENWDKLRAVLNDKGISFRYEPEFPSFQLVEGVVLQGKIIDFLKSLKDRGEISSYEVNNEGVLIINTPFRLS